MLLQKAGEPNGVASGVQGEDWKSHFEQIEWVDPNKKNLVAEGE
jgi:carbamoyl-phosphate synthase/aspartate carbamoyltransferase